MKMKNAFIRKGSSRKEDVSRMRSGSSKPMKGQFFIVGAVLICSLFFIGLPRFAPIIKEYSGDLTYISSNLRAELPHALNLGMNESAMLVHMTNFTHFLERVLAERNINYTSLWLVIQNQGTNDLNVTVANFLGEGVAVSINVSGTVETLQIGNGTMNDTVFSSVSSTYNITVSFSDQEETAEWPRDKASLYAFYRLTRGDDVIKNYIFA